MKLQIPPGLKDASMRVLNLVHRTVFDLSGGRIGGRGLGMPIVKLTTIGRTSGLARETMLSSPMATDNGGRILVASNGGDDRDPAWYRNLVANPEVTIEMPGRTFTARARTADPAEKAELWPQIAKVGMYAQYVKMTDRDIPVVICDPLDAPTN